MRKVILTGGTGLIGTKLSLLLLEQGYEVNILTRDPKKANEYKWDIDNHLIDEKVFDSAFAIIHLAGVSVADGRWTEERRKEIVKSRSASAQLLYQYLSKKNHSIKTVISASAVGYYGDRKDELLTEASSNGTGFLAEVCKQWEDEVDKLSALNIMVNKIRIGVVLSSDGGALQQLQLPVKFGIGAYMGDGKQFVPWIHIDDLCSMFLHLLENRKTGEVYNGCAPEFITNRQLSEAIAKALHRPFIPFPVPEFLLKTMMGEMSCIVLMSNKCSCQKIMGTGFQFRYLKLYDALKDIYSK